MSSAFTQLTSFLLCSPFYSSKGAPSNLNELARFWKDLKTLHLEKTYVINVLGILLTFVTFNFFMLSLLWIPILEQFDEPFLDVFPKIKRSHLFFKLFI